MKNKIRKFMIGTLALAQVLTGCATIPTKISLEDKVYSSPVLPKEYGFKTIGDVMGEVDETKPVYVKDNKLYIVGFSEAYGSEAGARDNAYSNANHTLMNLLNKEKGFSSGVMPTSTETRRIISKTGKTGYVAEVLCKTSLNNFDKKTQEMLRNQYETKEENKTESGKEISDLERYITKVRNEKGMFYDFETGKDFIIPGTTKTIKYKDTIFYELDKIAEDELKRYDKKGKISDEEAEKTKEYLRSIVEKGKNKK